MFSTLSASQFMANPMEYVWGLGLRWPTDNDTLFATHHKSDGTSTTETYLIQDTLTLTYPISSFSTFTAPGAYVIKAGWEDVGSRGTQAYDGYKETSFTINLWLPNTTGITEPPIQPGHIYKGGTIIDGQRLCEPVHSTAYNLYSYLSANNIYASDGEDYDTTYISYYPDIFNNQVAINTTLSTNSVTTILPQDNFSLTQPGLYTVTWTYHDSKYYNEYFADDPDATRSITLVVYDLEIDNTNNNWLPTKGGTLQKTATIKPTGVAGKIKFTLYDVSAEPGYCMNAVDSTISGADNSGKDLRFESQAGYTISGADSTVAEKNSEVNSASINVSCFDYGAYGKVKAELLTIAGNNITPLLAHLPSIMTTQFAKIPRDDNNSFIADGWFGDATTYADDTDSDPNFGTQGDGLSRYEEYRGFLVKTNHTRTSPFKKDLFIFDQNELYNSSFFTGASQLEVHLIDSTEFNGVNSRVVNFKNGAAPDGAHRVDQHGLWLHTYDADGGGARNADNGSWGITTGPKIGSPKENPEICIDVDQITWDESTERPDGGNNRFAEAKGYAITHELGHGIAIHHHSPINTGGVQTCVIRYLWNEWDVFRKPHDGRGGNNDADGWNNMTIGTIFCDNQDNCKSQFDVNDQD
ncbi:MAG: hypothetical protein ACE14V_14050 [bacterium]